MLNLHKVLAIPIWLLWRVRMKTSQKIGLGAFLCLSFCMILTAITRISGLRFHGSFDQLWLFMWQQIEASIAVTMLSLAAFRSLFVDSKLGPNKAHPWVPSTARRLARCQKTTPPDQQLNDLTIPSVTLTGLSRVYNGGREVQSSTESLTSDTWPLSSRSRQGLSSEV